MWISLSKSEQGSIGQRAEAQSSAGLDECSENFHLGLGRRQFLVRCSASESPADLGEGW